jgi:ribonuclease HII
VTPPTAPYRYEAQAWRAGVTRLAGIDEAGRGPLAGPVVAAAVVLARDRRIKGLADSKLLAPPEREGLFRLIQERALAVGVGIVDHETIDRINILQATRQAMAEALARLAVMPELIITDFVTLPALSCPQKNLVAGDRRCASVAAASIVAKVIRDRIMVEDLAALDLYGPCPIHRRTFVGVWRQGELFVL